MSIRRTAAFSAATALLGLASAAAFAQFATPSSPPAAGLREGTGAPFAKGHFKDLDALPDWGGIWFLTFSMPAPGSPPPPQPRLKGKYKDQLEAWRQEVVKNNGVVKDTSSHCSPPGMPIFMQIPQYPFEFLFTPGRVTINQEAWMQTRHIWTDGRKHPDDVDPSYAGHSVGHWEGDTLVADTVGIKDNLEIGMGMRHSDKLRITERIHLKPGDPNTLVDEITLDDPEALKAPFTATFSYRRDRYGELLEFQCSENDRNPVDANGNTEFK